MACASAAPRTTEQRDELASSFIEHGGSPLRWICRRSTLPQLTRQVLRADLNCSEIEPDVRVGSIATHMAEATACKLP
jgi:hypothetical protein